MINAAIFPLLQNGMKIFLRPLWQNIADMLIEVFAI